MDCPVLARASKGWLKEVLLDLAQASTGRLKEVLLGLAQAPTGWLKEVLFGNPGRIEAFPLNRWLAQAPTGWLKEVLLSLGAPLGCPEIWCSILGGTVLEVEICDVRLGVPLSKEIVLARCGASRSLISGTPRTIK